MENKVNLLPLGLRLKIGRILLFILFMMPLIFIWLGFLFSLLDLSIGKNVNINHIMTWAALIVFSIFFYYLDYELFWRRNLFTVTTTTISPTRLICGKKDEDWRSINIKDIDNVEFEFEKHGDKVEYAILRIKTSGNIEAEITLYDLKEQFGSYENSVKELEKAALFLKKKDTSGEIERLFKINWLIKGKN